MITANPRQRSFCNASIAVGLIVFQHLFRTVSPPLIIWIACREDSYVAMHSKRALISHILPFVAALPLLFLTFGAEHLGSVLGYIILFIIIYFGTFIYNIVKGIQVLREYA